MKQSYFSTNKILSNIGSFKQMKGRDSGSFSRSEISYYKWQKENKIQEQVGETQ